MLITPETAFCASSGSALASIGHLSVPGLLLRVRIASLSRMPDRNRVTAGALW